ncbi:hypothetical protein ALC57_18701 [Trachymyrmex cornetzi]|uniref:DDE Tnp4 domain-containing protein n=1 Tax=Trachymyrmex cornetzi TaxID=471704 RepID=A0A151IR87_9HYME|nr:hypothetical protein ALC57_18701 [Trachymyrmex cornetzi]
MALRLNCYVCDGRFLPRTMALIDGEANAAKQGIAIQRRDHFDRQPLEVTHLTRICINCNQSITAEIAAIEQDPSCMRLNVLTQTKNSTCLICNADIDVHRLSVKCKAYVFIQRNIFILGNVKSCRHHLNDKDVLLPHLLLGLPDKEFKCFCPVTKEQFQELFTFCDRVPRHEGGYRSVSKKDLLAFLCKMRQGLSDEFLASIFQYSDRPVVSRAVTTVREALRQLYCVHKGRHLVKPVLIVASDGYIFDIQGPYFSDVRNNDAAILRNEFETDVERMRRWLQENDIIIVDRGYRDSTELLQRLGIVWKMPALLEPGDRQLRTEDANESRLVTHVPHVGNFYRITAIINRYHLLINMREANAQMAQQLLQKAREPNVVKALVEAKNLATRNAQRWVRLSAEEVLDFPVLTLEYLKNLTIRVYQVKFAPSYIRDKQRHEDEELHIEMLRDRNRLPEPGFLRARVFSRFCNATKLWIVYRSTNEDENEKMKTLYKAIIARANPVLALSVPVHTLPLSSGPKDVQNPIAQPPRGVHWVMLMPTVH